LIELCKSQVFTEAKDMEDLRGSREQGQKYPSAPNLRSFPRRRKSSHDLQNTLASKQNGTLYLGHTDDLGERILQHKLKINNGFSSRYNCVRLVWFETNNPEWDDLYDDLTTDQVYHPRYQYQAAKL